jgi:hypothetical protein
MVRKIERRNGGNAVEYLASAIQIRQTQLEDSSFIHPDLFEDGDRSFDTS